jgi:hypothetical protein
MQFKSLTSALALAFAILASEAHAAKIESNTFSFKFKYKNEVFNTDYRASTWEEAFERAAKACYLHYKNNRSISEEIGLDIIDTCANPSHSI